MSHPRERGLEALSSGQATSRGTAITSSPQALVSTQKTLEALASTKKHFGVWHMNLIHVS